MSTLLLPWSTVLVALPLSTALVLSRLANRRRARKLAMISGVLSLAIALGLLLAVAGLEGEHVLLVDPSALPGLAPRPLLGVDLLSAPILVLVALVSLASIWGTSVTEAPARTLTRIAALQAATYLALLSQHAALFVAAWALTLIPVVLELRARGASRMAAVFFAYQGAGLVVLVGSLLVFGGGAAIFERSGEQLELGCLVGVGIAALARQGLFPLHSWVPSLHEQASPGLTALTLLPQLGGYLLLRVLVESPGAASSEVFQVLLVLGAASAVYAALLGVVQLDLRRGVGWLAASQSALVICGLVTQNAVGLSGGLLLCLSSALALVGLLLTVSAIEARFGPVDLSQPRGLAGRTPTLGVFFLLLGFASVGLPGSLGFVAEDLLFHGALEMSPAVGLGLVVATAINGFSVLRLYYRAFQGGRPALPRVEDALPRERLVLLSLVLLLLVGGLWPRALVETHARAASEIRSLSSHAAGD